MSFKYKTLDDLYSKSISLGFDFVSSDEMDCAWLNLDDDIEHTISEIIGIANNNKDGVTVYGMYTNVDVVKFDEVFYAKIYNVKTGEVKREQKIWSDYDLTDFLLIHFKGSDGIHDYGKRVVDEED